IHLAGWNFVSFTFAKMQEMVHEVYMQRCLQLAQSGAGNVAPNPMVGAVLVYEDTIIGEGYHQNYGGPHAEVHCINDAVKNHAGKISGSTLYVSLEPCAHFGKTPPCADLIIQHKIPKVVIACTDSFEKVAGKGIERLKNAGVDVTVGVLEKEAIALNRAFFTYHGQQRPYITLKWAQTANGYIAGIGPERLMISNDYANRLVHKWRSAHTGILVGANTAIKDDPLLDNRNWWGTPPKKILFDPNLKVPVNLRLFKNEEVVFVFNTLKNAVSKNIIYLKMEDDNSIADMLRQLYTFKIQSLLVEGGRYLHTRFINACWWDEARVITNKTLQVGQGLPAPRLSEEVLLKETRIINDEILFYKNQNNPYIHAATGLF